MNIGLFQPGMNNQQQFSPTNLIITVDNTIGKEYLKKAIEEYHAEILYIIILLIQWLLKFQKIKTLKKQ